MNKGFEGVWNQILKRPVARLETPYGMPFQYAIQGESVIISILRDRGEMTTVMFGPLSKKQFRDVHRHMTKGGDLGSLLDGRVGVPYMWAILQSVQASESDGLPSGARSA